MAYGQTLNRPEFREIAPFSFYDFVNNRNITGNPNLKNAQVQNADFRYEFYPTPAEVLSIAAFYKKFTNPIEVRVLRTHRALKKNIHASTRFCFCSPQGQKLFLQKLRAEAHFLLTICVEVARLMSMRAVRTTFATAG